MRQLLYLIQKDVRLECRLGEMMVLMGGLALLLSVMLSFGVGSAVLPQETVLRLFPSLCWLLFVFVATLAMTRSFVAEEKHQTLEGLRLAGVPAASLYLSRYVVTSLILFVFQLAASVVLTILLGLPLLDIVTGGSFVLLTGLVVCAYASLSTLLAAIAAASRLGGMLLPLLLFPLLFPVLFAAIELTAGLLESGLLQYDSWWFTLLICMVLMYSALGSALFEFLIGE